ncbi:MAG: hypothetical protein HY319_16155 [Armatimonadetes bacterium]|nr:hypothetical protein [Armatimonadota bacterium]
MSALAQILHNLHEHTETYHRLLTGQDFDPEFQRRLLAHILLEERRS